MDKTAREVELHNCSIVGLYAIAKKYGRNYGASMYPDNEECIRFILAMEFSPKSLDIEQSLLGKPVL
jgi:hypothetical protein